MNTKKILYIKNFFFDYTIIIITYLIKCIYGDNNNTNTTDNNNNNSNDNPTIDLKYKINNNDNLINVDEIIKIDNYNYIIGNNVAILFCIANFVGKNSDLTYCVNDCITMILELMERNFTIFILGDNLINELLVGKSISLEKYGVSCKKIDNLNNKLIDYSNKIYYCYAYESKLYNVINTVIKYSNNIDKTNFLLYFSGHGTKTNENKIDKTNSSICDIDFKDISEYDIIQNIITPLKKSKNIVIIYDNCNSGGLIDNLKSYDENSIFAISAASYNGFGYDDSNTKHGMLTFNILNNINLLFNNDKDNIFDYDKLKILYNNICDNYIKKAESTIQIDYDYIKDYPMCYINGKLYDHTNYKSMNNY